MIKPLTCARKGCGKPVGKWKSKYCCYSCSQKAYKDKYQRYSLPVKDSQIYN